MWKWNKIIITISGLCLIYIIVVYLLPSIGYYKARAYNSRPVECSPQNLIPDLEEMYDIDFPKDIREIKTAKSIPIKDHITFIVKFIAEPDIVDIFIKSFLKGIVLVKYDPEWDVRSASVLPLPAWFTKPIQQGKMGEVPGHGDNEIYIDTINEKEFVVYFFGYYDKVLLERKRQQ